MFLPDMSDSYYEAQYGLGANVFQNLIQKTKTLVQRGTAIYKRGNAFYKMINGKEVPATAAEVASAPVMAAPPDSGRPAWLIPAAVVAGLLTLGLFLKKRA